MTDDRDHTLPAGLGLMRAIDEAEVGSLIDGRYRLDQRIGSGGMGSVWRARDLVLGRDVAIKLVILASALARGRFVREGKVAALLNHPGLCKVYDVGEHHGVGHLVMELLAGETLFARVHRTNPGPEQRLSLMAEVARAMAIAHGQGLVHRDLKPDNIFIDSPAAALDARRRGASPDHHSWDSPAAALDARRRGASPDHPSWDSPAAALDARRRGASPDHPSWDSPAAALDARRRGASPDLPSWDSPAAALDARRRGASPDHPSSDHLTGRERAVVIDFGLAFLDGDAQGELGRLTQSDVAGGTPAYMAPEQARALAIGPAADVYALGCVLFELMAGRPPFEGAPTVVMSHQVFATPPVLADLAPEAGPGVTALVGAMLDKAPDRRPSMAEVADRLELLSVSLRASTPRTSSRELRVHRMLTRNALATGALPTGPAIGALIAIGPVPDEVLVAAASAGLTATRAVTPAVAGDLARAEPRTVIVAEADDDTLVALCRLGPPVIAVAAVGDLELAVRLGRLGCVDVVTRPIQPSTATRKILRALRRLPSRPA